MQKLIDKVTKLCEEFLTAKNKKKVADHISYYMLSISERDSGWAWTSELSTAKDFLSHLNEYEINSELDEKVKEIMHRINQSQ